MFLLLSYIPFRKQISHHSSGGFSGSSDLKLSSNSVDEGMYHKDEGKHLSEQERTSNKEQIDSFIGFVFENQSQLNLKLFNEFNTQVSSEMLVSVMSILHERLPCAQYYFRQRQLFKDREIQKSQKKLLPINTGKGADADEILSQAEDMVMSPFKAIASPQILHGWSNDYSSAQKDRKNSTFKPLPVDDDNCSSNGD